MFFWLVNDHSTQTTTTEFVLGAVFSYADLILFGTLKWIASISPEGEEALRTDDGALLAWWHRVNQKVFQI